MAEEDVRLKCTDIKVKFSIEKNIVGRTAMKINTSAEMEKEV